MNNELDEKSVQEIQKVYDVLDRWEAPMKEMLLKICEEIGYGRVLQLVSQTWVTKDPVGAFVIGTCKGMVVPCGCERAHKCDWCCGAGWLTEHVSKVKKEYEQANWRPEWKGKD